MEDEGGGAGGNILLVFEQDKTPSLLSKYNFLFYVKSMSF